MNLASTQNKFYQFILQIFAHFSWIPLIAIFLDSLHKVYFLVHLKESAANVAYTSVIWVALQIIFATLLGLISDKYCRKKILLLSI